MKIGTHCEYGQNVSLEELACLVVERLAVRLRMRHAQHVHVRERVEPYGLVDLAQPIDRDHAADDVPQLDPRVFERDLARLQRHFRILTTISFSLSRARSFNL